MAPHIRNPAIDPTQFDRIRHARGVEDGGTGSRQLATIPLAESARRRASETADETVKRIEERLLLITQETDAVRADLDALHQLAANPGPAAITPKVLTIAQVQAALGVSESTVKTLIRTGELESVVVGERGRRIPVDAVDYYIASLRTAG